MIGGATKVDEAFLSSSPSAEHHAEQRPSDSLTWQLRN